MLKFLVHDVPKKLPLAPIAMNTRSSQASKMVVQKPSFSPKQLDVIKRMYAQDVNTLITNNSSSLQVSSTPALIENLTRQEESSSDESVIGSSASRKRMAQDNDHSDSSDESPSDRKRVTRKSTPGLQPPTQERSRVSTSAPTNVNRNEDVTKLYLLKNNFKTL